MADRRRLGVERRKVLKGKALRVEIIQLHHDTLVDGHEGKWKTTELVMRNYWWPGVTRNMENIYI